MYFLNGNLWTTICGNYVLDMSTVCENYVLDMSTVCGNYVLYMFIVCENHVLDVSGACLLLCTVFENVLIATCICI